MKTIISLVVFCISSVAVLGQSNVYHQKMGEALAGFSNVESDQDYLQLASQFERIGQVETTEWLPKYYHAQCYILMNFANDDEDPATRDGYLDVAEQSIEAALKLAPEESEIYALQAFYYTGRLVINPMERGQKFSGLSNGAIKQALKLDPDNPRAKYLDITNKMGTAEFFGQDPNTYCSEATALLNGWDDYKPESLLHPNWGKGQVREIVAACGSEAPEAEAKTGFDLTINITKLKSDKGTVLLEVLNEDGETVRQTGGQIADGKSKIVITDLPAGSYAVQFFHDANGNMSMDTGKYGKPTEGYGFSNNVKASFGPPEFEKTVFKLNSDQSIELVTR